MEETLDEFCPMTVSLEEAPPEDLLMSCYDTMRLCGVDIQELYSGADIRLQRGEKFTLEAKGRNDVKGSFDEVSALLVLRAYPDEAKAGKAKYITVRLDSDRTHEEKPWTE